MPPAVILGLVAALLFGVSIGSFLNVVIWRLPQGLSVADPTWSFCPNCRTRLGTLDLIPLISFLALGRKCRTCHKPISWRYFTVESITGLLFLAVAWRNYGPLVPIWDSINVMATLTAVSVETIFQCLFVAVMVAIFFIDLDCFMIPNRLPFAAFLIGCGAAVARYWVILTGGGDRAAHFTGNGVGMALEPVVICAAGYALVFHAISFLGYLYYTSQPVEREDGSIASPTKSLPSRAWSFVAAIVEDYAYLGARILGLKFIFPAVRRWVESIDALMRLEGGDSEVSREEIQREIENDEEQSGMGHGDAKLAGAIGANLLFPLVLVSFFASVLIGGLVGIAMMLVFRARGKTAIPFGPYMVAGALIALFIGHPLWDWYVGLLHGGAGTR